MKQVLWILNYITLASVLGIAIWQDVRTQKIKNKLNVAGVLLGFFFALIIPEKGGLFALFGFAAMLAVGLLCWKLHFFRAGDAKLLCAVGAFCGWEAGLSCLMEAIIIGAVLGLPFVIRRLWKKQKGKTAFPFSIAIAAACVIVEVFGYLWDIIA